MNARPASDDYLWRVVTLPPVPQAVADGRAWSRETVKEWQLDGMTDVVQQLVSELVTNSIEHADTSCVRVLLLHKAGTLRLDVTDDDVASLPVRGQAGVDDIRGRGLAIVEALSDTWGVRITAHAKTVWCEFGEMGAQAPRGDLGHGGFGGVPRPAECPPWAAQWRD